MSKLSFEALKERAATTNQQQLLKSVSGGTCNACHPCSICNDPELNGLEKWLAHIILQ